MKPEEEQVKLYCEQMNQEKALHKANETLKNTLKKFLTDMKKDVLKSGKYKVSLQSRVSESIDEAQMLAVLKTYWEKAGKGKQCPFIRTQEFVDMDVLEGYIYKDKLPKYLLLELDKCRVKKETVALTYSVEKGED